MDDIRAVVIILLRIVLLDLPTYYLLLLGSLGIAVILLYVGAKFVSFQKLPHIWGGITATPKEVAIVPSWLFQGEEFQPIFCLATEFCGFFTQFALARDTVQNLSSKRPWNHHDCSLHIVETTTNLANSFKPSFVLQVLAGRLWVVCTRNLHRHTPLLFRQLTCVHATVQAHLLVGDEGKRQPPRPVCILLE